MAASAFPVPHGERYQGVRFQGQGGMGQVFLAHEPRLRLNLALEFVKGDDAEAVRRLMCIAVDPPDFGESQRQSQLLTHGGWARTCWPAEPAVEA